ncbi:MAG: hypothetical protein HC915_17900 [Anaerolineae bacterium]|nr:hypothetical protein [Anaerolineae bacterium]
MFSNTLSLRWFWVDDPLNRAVILALSFQEGDRLASSLDANGRVIEWSVRVEGARFGRFSAPWERAQRGSGEWWSVGSAGWLPRF